MIADPNVPPSSGPRLAVDSGLVRRAVDAGIIIAERALRGGSTDPKVAAFVDALKQLHLDLAGAEFDARLPRPPARPGGEVLTPQPATFIETEEQPS